MKPKRQKIPWVQGTEKSLNPRIGYSPQGVTWETYLRIVLEDYQREQNRLYWRYRDQTGGPKGSSSRHSSTFGSFGPKANNRVSTPAGRMTLPDRRRDRYPVSHLHPQHKGGVMTDNVQNVNGRRVIVTTSTGGTPRVTTQSTNVQSVIAYQKILQFVTSTKGDHKRPNPHSYQVLRIDQGSGVKFAGDGFNNTLTTGTQSTSFGFGGSFTDKSNSAYNQAVARCYDKLRGDVDLSVDAFQARQTGVMINHRFAQARKLFTRAAPEALWAKRRVVNVLKRSNPRDWGNLWLEWIYGWKPLANDLYQSMEEMMVSSCRKPNGVSGHPIRVSGYEVGDNRLVRTVDGSNVTRDKVIFSKYHQRITCFYVVANTRLNSIANYTSLNPVSIVWELIPYSFVVDWFINVGGYLRNLESSLLYGSDLAYGYRNALMYQHEMQTAAGGNNAYSEVASGDYQLVGFNRIILNSSPTPRLPSFDPKLGTTRLLSAASLLGQQLHSLKHVRNNSDRNSGRAL